MTPVNGLVSPAGPVSKIGKYFSRGRMGAAPQPGPLLSYSAAPTFLFRRPYFLSGKTKPRSCSDSFQRG